MAPGTPRQASLEPLRWRLRLPRAALAFAEPTLVPSSVAPRVPWGEVPGGPGLRHAAAATGSSRSARRVHVVAVLAQARSGLRPLSIPVLAARCRPRPCCPAQDAQV